MSKIYSKTLGVYRREFGPNTGTSEREQAEEETRRDLLKPIQQLLADVHEEAEGSAIGVETRKLRSHKRMVSMLARVAISNNRVSNYMLSLTVVMTVLTVVMLVLTWLLWKQPTNSQLQQLIDLQQKTIELKH